MKTFLFIKNTSFSFSIFKKILLFSFLLFLNFTFFNQIAKANVDDFVINSYAVDFNLSRDDKNQSILTTTETITAFFPNQNQNHGLERIIPLTYQNHPLRQKNLTITDENGKPLEYTATEDSNQNLIIRIGDKNIYVQGEKTYVISYTYENVTTYFEDTNADELYWNTNGTYWRVPIKNLSITLNISDELATKLTGKSACYFGARGSTNLCELSHTKQTLFLASAFNLNRGENITIAIGFKPETFSPFIPTFWEQILDFAHDPFKRMIISILGIFTLLATLIFKGLKIHKHNKIPSPIVTEFTPPKDFSVLQAASLLNIKYTNKTLTAQIVELAINGYLKIIETKPKSIFSKNDYEIELLKPVTDLKAEEKEVLIDLFQSDNPEIGNRFSFKKLSSFNKVIRSLIDNPAKLTTLELKTYQTKKILKSPFSTFVRLLPSIFLLIIGLILSNKVLLFIAFAMIFATTEDTVLTDKGKDLTYYLEGLKKYMEVAEKERIKILQSPEGAEKTNIDTNDKEQVVKLYEKLLPYAIIFNQEKKWQEALAIHYTEAEISPTWIVGVDGLAVPPSEFNNTLKDFNFKSNVSTSGGTSGGGSSGGGGGGGGGGGW